MTETETLLHEETLRGGASWSWRLRRGMRLRLTDTKGGGNVSMTLHSAEQPLERYNMPDTLKAQHTFFLALHRACYSDMGRVLISIVGDTLGWHDTITGCSDATTVAERFGSANYQDHRNDRYRNGRDNLLVELHKHGLGKRDMTAPINWFTKVAPGSDGNLTWVADHSPAGSSVTMRADMDTIVCLTTNQHPLDPSTTYAPKPVHIELFAGEPAATDDPCRHSSEQSGRAFALTDQYHLGA